MNIGFIGSGRMATAFGLYLKHKNFHISGYYSRSYASALTASDHLHTESFQNLEMLLEKSDWIGITTSDDEIESVVEALMPYMKSLPHKVFFHMSGSKASSSLYPLQLEGHHCISLHPLQSIADPLLGSDLLSKSYFSVEGDSTPEIEGFLEQFDKPVIRLSAEQKILYHAAACVASNYLYTLAEEAVEMMTIAGFEPKMALEALLPLMAGTLENLKEQSPETALTGPIARGDLKTVENHLTALNAHPALKRVYKEMGLATLQLASRRRLKDFEQIKKLTALLKVEEEQEK